MKITDVKVFPVDEDKLKAYATITFENCFIVRDLKVISGNKGYFIAMPSKKRKDGTFRDVAHPLNSETRKMIEDAVLEVYEAENVPSPVEESSSYGAEETSATQEEPVASEPVEEQVDSTEDTVVEAASEDADSDSDSQGEDAPAEETVETFSEAAEAYEEAPAEVPVEEDPPAEDLLAETSPAEDPPAEDPPAEDPPAEAPLDEESQQGAEHNPTIEPVDDPEKAFGYEE